MTPPTKAMLELADEIHYCIRIGIKPILTEESWMSIVNAIRPSQQEEAIQQEEAKRIADDLERLCCAETEKQFFDYVAERAGTIIAMLRAHADHRSSQNNRDSGERERAIEALEIGREFAAYHTRPFPQNISGKLEKIDAAIRALKSGEKGS